MMQQFMTRQFIFFILTGGFSAVVNFLSRIIYNQWLGFSTSVTMAYITGMIVAFILAKLFVFKKSEQSIHRSAIFFVLVNLFAIMQTWLLSMGLAYYLLPSLGVTSFVREIAHAISLGSTMFISYFGHKKYSFK